MFKSIKLHPWQSQALNSPYVYTAFYGGVGCVRGSTLINTKNGLVRIDRLQKDTEVWSLGENGLVLSKCGSPFLKGKARLYRICHEAGEFVAHERHLVLCASGGYQYVGDLSLSEKVFLISSNPLQTISEYDVKCFLSVLNYLETNEDCLCDYQELIRLCGQQLPQVLIICQALIQKGIDALTNIQNFLKRGDFEILKSNIHRGLLKNHHAKLDYLRRTLVQALDVEAIQTTERFEQTLPIDQQFLQFQMKSETRQINVESLYGHEVEALSYSSTYSITTIKSIEKLSYEELFWDVEINETNNYLSEGVIHHNSGKTTTGAHFAIKYVLEKPEVPQFIGANSYDQLSTATLKELFYWLDHYGFEYVCDRRPPIHWQAMVLKTYKNTVHIRNPYTGKGVTIFTRVLSDPNNIRGMEFGVFWLDELRDVEEYAFQMVIGRMRGYDFAKGLCTTTTNGESWDYNLFVLRGNKDDKIYGSMHVETIEAVKRGTLTQFYYDSLLRSYSPIMAEQELFAKHVNISGGRAYYAASSKNKMRVSPWGDEVPDTRRNLIIGCDFNFQPAPCVWIVGQVGPGDYYDKIHWFGEISATETSTEQMTLKLLNQFPGFFYEIYGDASGMRGTTSNAGQTDFDIIGITLSNYGALYTIDVDQANPRVKDRIENMNGLLLNAFNEVRMTYNPDTCPLFDGDMKIVGWRKPAQASWQGKLDDMGDKQRTHSSDGAGYAAWKKFPPGKQRSIIQSLHSTAREDIMGAI